MFREDNIPRGMTEFNTWEYFTYTKRRHSTKGEEDKVGGDGVPCCFFTSLETYYQREHGSVVEDERVRLWSMQNIKTLTIALPFHGQCIDRTLNNFLMYR